MCVGVGPGGGGGGGGEGFCNTIKEEQKDTRTSRRPVLLEYDHCWHNGWFHDWI